MNDTHDERGGDEAAVLLAIRRRALTASTYAEWHQVGRDIETLIEQLAAATACAEKAEAVVAKLRTDRDHCVAREITAKIEARQLRARLAELGEPTYRGVACWPPIASPDGRSEPVEHSETSGGHGEGSNSSTTAAGLFRGASPSRLPQPLPRRHVPPPDVRTLQRTHEQQQPGPLLGVLQGHQNQARAPLLLPR